MTGGPAGSDLRTLLDRADDYAACGDIRAAVSFYQSALRSVSDPRSVDPALMADLRRAQSFIVDRAREFQDRLESAVAGVSPANPVAAALQRHSLDLLKGERQVFQQQQAVF